MKLQGSQFSTKTEQTPKLAADVLRCINAASNHRFVVFPSTACQITNLLEASKGNKFANCGMFCVMLRNAVACTAQCELFAEWVSVNSCSPCVPATCSLNKSWIFIYRVENYQDFLLFNPQSLLMSPITMLFPSRKWKTGSLIKYTIFFHKRRHHKLRKMTYVNEWRISKIFILPFDKQIVSALRIKSLNKTTWKPTMSKVLLSWPQY